MLTQEAAYKQIQDAKIMVEDDLQHKLDEFEEERVRLIKLANTASTLERELEQVGMQNVIQLQYMIVFCVLNAFHILFLSGKVELFPEGHTAAVTPERTSGADAATDHYSGESSHQRAVH